MEKMMGEEMNPEAIKAFSDRGYAIPGQSWTQPVEDRRPFETAPDFTDMHEALQYTALELLDEENYVPIVLAIGDGVPIMDLALQMGYVGFREGKWNPDLMLMLLEPFAYLLMALAEKAGVGYRLDSDDLGNMIDMEDGESDEEEKMLVMRAKNIANVAARKKAKESGGVPEGVIPTDIAKKIEELPPIESLLDRQVEEGDSASLLARGEE